MHDEGLFVSQGYVVDLFVALRSECDQTKVVEVSDEMIMSRETKFGFFRLR